MTDISKIGAFNQTVGALIAVGMISYGVPPRYVAIAALCIGVMMLPALVRTVRTRYRIGVNIG